MCQKVFKNLRKMEASRSPFFCVKALPILRIGDGLSRSAKNVPESVQKSPKNGGLEVSIFWQMVHVKAPPFFEFLRYFSRPLNAFFFTLFFWVRWFMSKHHLFLDISVSKHHLFLNFWGIFRDRWMRFFSRSFFGSDGSCQSTTIFWTFLCQSTSNFAN